MPPRALAVLLLCAAVFASACVAGVHLVSGLATAAATVEEPASSPVATAGTRRVDLAPVDATGNTAPGWSARDGDIEVECGYASPAAVSPGIQTCSPSAAAADVCWPGPGGSTVTCLLDPWTRELVRYPATDTATTVSAPPNPSPVGLELTDGTQCRLRNGGAWSGRADDPDMYGAYSCSSNDDLIVWSGRDDREIDVSAPVWTVRVGTPTGPLRTAPVAVAYYAATA